MESTDHVSTHISKVENFGMKLKQSGEPVMDNMIITKILMTLPDVYNHFYSAWDSIPAADKKINNLTSRLLIEKSRLKQRSLTVVENQKSIALMANNSKKDLKFGSKGKTNKKKVIVIFVIYQDIGNINIKNICKIKKLRTQTEKRVILMMAMFLSLEQ